MPEYTDIMAPWESPWEFPGNQCWIFKGDPRLFDAAVAIAWAASGRGGSLPRLWDVKHTYCTNPKHIDPKGVLNLNPQLRDLVDLYNEVGRDNWNKSPADIHRLVCQDYSLEEVLQCMKLFGRR